MVRVPEDLFRLRITGPQPFFGGPLGLRQLFHRELRVLRRDVDADQRPWVLLRQHAEERVGGHDPAPPLAQLVDETPKVVGREPEMLAQQIAGAEEDDLGLLPIHRLEDVLHRPVLMRPAGDGVHVVDVQPLREQQSRATGQLLPQDEEHDRREFAEVVVEDEQEPRRWHRSRLVPHDGQLLEPAFDRKDVAAQIVGSPERGLPAREPRGGRWPGQAGYEPTHGHGLMMGGDGLRDAPQPDEGVDAQEVQASQVGDEGLQLGQRLVPLFALQELDRATQPCRRTRMQRLGPLQERGGQ